MPDTPDTGSRTAEELEEEARALEKQAAVSDESARYWQQLEDGQRDVDFGEAFRDTVRALGGGQPYETPDSRDLDPDSYADLAQNRREEAAELRRNAAALRREAARLRGEADDIMAEIDSPESRDAQLAVAVGGGSRGASGRRVLPFVSIGVVLAMLSLAALLYGLGVFGGGAASAPTGSATPGATGRGTATVAPTATAVAAPPGFGEISDLGLFDGEAVADAPGDGIYSIPGTSPGHFPGHVDLVASGANVVNAPAQVVDPAFNHTVFDCTRIVDDVFTACASTNPVAPGPLFVAAARMAEPIPREPSEGLLTYALVLQADGEAGNDYQPQAPFTDDFYQGSDRWYELVYTSDLGWYLTVDRNETPSSARAAIMGDLVVFFVPMSEIAVDLPSYRLSAFAGSDASFAPETSGGDVSTGPPDAEWMLVPPDGATEAAAGFVTRLGDALAGGDTAFVYERLHSAVLERYGADACEPYVAAVVGPSSDLTPAGASGPEAWDYVTDGVTTTIDGAYAVVTSGTLQGQVVTDTEFHVAMEEGAFRWFTDCGVPSG